MSLLDKLPDAPRCTNTPGCQLADGHRDGCGGWGELLRRVGERAANAMAARVLKAIGHEVKP